MFEKKKNANSLAKTLAFTALFAALCCVSTMAITIPLPASGYFNTGDVFVLLAGWILGPLFGPIAAAVGSMLADIFLGAPIYAPATFIIKGIVAFVAYLLSAFLKKGIKKSALDVLSRGVSAIIAEGIMVVGYFAYECILTNAISALPNILGNVLQGCCCAVVAVALATALGHIRAVKNLFPSL